MPTEQAIDSIRIGQIFKDKDKRQHGRFIKAQTIGGNQIHCVPCREDGTEFLGRRTSFMEETLRRRFEMVGTV